MESLFHQRTKDIVLKQHVVEEAKGGIINDSMMYIYEGGCIQLIDRENGNVVASHFFKEKINHVEAYTYYSLIKLLIAVGDTIQIMDINTGEIIEYIESKAFEGKTIHTFVGGMEENEPDTLRLFVAVNTGELFKVDISLAIVGLTEQENRSLTLETTEQERRMEDDEGTTPLISQLETIHVIKNNKEERILTLLFTPHNQLLFIITSKKQLITIHYQHEMTLESDLSDHFPSNEESTAMIMHSLIHPKDPERSYILLADPQLPILAMYVISYMPTQNSWLFKLLMKQSLGAKRVAHFVTIDDTIEDEVDTEYIADLSKVGILYTIPHGVICEVLHLQQYLVDQQLYKSTYTLHGLDIQQHIVGAHIFDVYSTENGVGALSFQLGLFDINAIYEYGIQATDDAQLDSLMSSFDAITCMHPEEDAQSSKQQEIMQYLDRVAPLPMNAKKEDLPYLYFMALFDVLLEAQSVSFITSYIQATFTDSLGASRHVLYSPALLLKWVQRRLDQLSSRIDHVVHALLGEAQPRVLSEKVRDEYLLTLLNAIQELNALDVVMEALSKRVTDLESDLTRFQSIVTAIDMMRTSYSVIRWFTFHELLPHSSDRYPFATLQSKWSQRYHHYLTDSFMLSVNDDVSVKNKSVRLPYFIELLLERSKVKSTLVYPPQSLRELILSFVFVEQTVDQKRAVLLIYLYLLIDMVEAQPENFDPALINHFVRQFHISLAYQELIYAFWSFDTFVGDQSDEALNAHDFSCLIRHSLIVDEWSDDIIHRLFKMGSIYQAERFLVRHSCSDPILRARVLLASNHMFEAIDYSRTLALCDPSTARAIFMTTFYYAVESNSLSHFFSLALTTNEEKLLHDYLLEHMDTSDAIQHLLALYTMHGAFAKAVELSNVPLALLGNIIKGLPLPQKAPLLKKLDFDALLPKAHHQDVMDDDSDSDIEILD